MQRSNEYYNNLLNVRILAAQAQTTSTRHEINRWCVLCSRANNAKRNPTSDDPQMSSLACQVRDVPTSAQMGLMHLTVIMVADAMVGMGAMVVMIAVRMLVMRTMAMVTTMVLMAMLMTAVTMRRVRAGSQHRNSHEGNEDYATDYDGDDDGDSSDNDG